MSVPNIHAHKASAVPNPPTPSLMAALKGVIHEAGNSELAKKFKTNVLDPIKDIQKVYRLTLHSNPFKMEPMHAEVIYNLSKSFLLKVIPTEHIKYLQLDLEWGTLEKLFENSRNEARDLVDITIDSTLPNSSDTLRIIIMSDAKNLGMAVRLELRTKESALLLADDPNAAPFESVTLDIYTKDKGISWKSLISHIKTNRKHKSRFNLNKTDIAELNLVKDTEETTTLDVATPAEETAANIFLQRKVLDPDNAVNSILLLPPIPKNATEAKRYSEFSQYFNAASDKLRFKNQKTLRNFLKKFLKGHLDNPKNTARVTADEVIGQIEDGQPVLFLLDHFSNPVHTPQHMPNGLADGFSIEAIGRSLVDFVEHLKLIAHVSKNVHTKMHGVHKARRTKIASETESETNTPTLSAADMPLQAEELPSATESPSKETPPLAQVPNIKDQQEVQKLRTTIEAQQLRIQELEAELARNKVEQQKLAEDAAIELATNEINVRDLKIADLERRLQLSKTAEHALSERIKALERSGALSESELSKLRDLEIQGISSVKNAVAFASALHPKSFELTPQAQKQLDSLSVSDSRSLHLSQEIYASLTGLWHVLWKQGAPKNLESKGLLFKQLTGLDIAFDETKVTKEKLTAQDERRFNFEGQTYMAWPHIKLSDKKRIYFAIDSDNKRVIIHSWPNHLWTHHDGSLK